MSKKSSPSSHEAQYRSIVDTAVDPIIVIDEAGTIIAFNLAAERTFGYDEAEVIGRNVKMLMSEPHHSAHDEYLARYRRTGERRIIGIGREVEARRKDGSTFPIELSVAEWRSDGKRFFTGILRNISERKEAERAQRRLREELERERALLSSIIEHLPSGLMVLEAATGRIVAQNAAADRLLGHGGADAASTEGHGRFRSERPDGKGLLAQEHPLARVVEHGAEIEQEQIVYTRPDGRQVTLLCNAGPVRDADREIVFGVSTFIDISERRELEAQVEHLARHDPLTGLANRILFGERLAEAVLDAGERESRAALVVIDLDRFKSVNDSFGHLVGDALLREVASRIDVAIRPGDTAARIGGDEFAVVLHGASSPAAVEAATNRIASTVMQPALIDGHVIEVDASIGYAICPGDAQDPETLLHHADLALYHSKYSAQRVFAFHQGLADEADREARMEIDLRRAIEADELVLHYQPQIELSTRRVMAVEALVRWNRGGVLVPPAEFIPLAEKSGTIHRLGEWVIRAACRQTAKWQLQDRHFKVCINISPVQANTPDLISVIDRALAESGLDGTSIELEITEGMLINPKRPSVAAFLGACQSRSIGLAIDDFGVGYSSLGYLARLPITKVKIDRSFLEHVGGGTSDSLLDAMIDLGHKLGKRVVAEGVETLDQCRYLRAAGELDAQGFHFAPPQPPDVLDAWLIDSGSAAGHAC